MNVKTLMGIAAAIAVSMLVATGSAGAPEGLDRYRDGPERGPAPTSGSAAVAYFWANERATTPPLASGSGSYIRGEEHGVPVAGAAEGLDSYRDGPERSHALMSDSAAVAYFSANERATLVQST